MVKLIGKEFGNFHRFQLFKACTFLNAVFANAFHFVFQMAYIGNVANITNLVAEMLQVTEQHVKSDIRPAMSKVCRAVNRRAAYIHAYMRRIKRSEKFLCSR